MGEALATSSTIRHVVEDANRYFKKALRIHPNDVRTLKWLAYTDLMLGHESLARETLEQIIATAPSDEFAHYWLHQIVKNSPEGEE